jgi:hypothetical protein
MRVTLHTPLLDHFHPNIHASHHHPLKHYSSSKKGYTNINPKEQNPALWNVMPREAIIQGRK